MNADVELFDSEAEKQKPVINNGLNALVVEDSKSIRMAISLLLKQSGFTVNTATDGIEGLQRFMKKDFDLLVTDLHMPNMDGYQLFNQIIQLSNTNKRNIHVLISSSDSKKTTILKILGIARSSKKSIPLSFLVKPWKQIDFYSQIRNLFPKNIQLLELEQKISLLNQEKVEANESRLIIGISETSEGIRIELGCDQALSLESDSITEYLDSLENAIFCAPIETYICSLSRMVHQSPVAMVTLLLLIRGLADKYHKKLQFVDAPLIIKSEVKRQGLQEIIQL